MKQSKMNGVAAACSTSGFNSSGSNNSNTSSHTSATGSQQVKDKSICYSSDELEKERQVHSVVSPRSVQISLSSSSSSHAQSRPNPDTHTFLTPSSSTSTTQMNQQHQNQYHITATQKHEIQDVYSGHQNQRYPLHNQLMKSSGKHFDNDGNDNGGDDYDGDGEDNDNFTLPFLSIEAISTKATTSSTLSFSSSTSVANHYNKQKHHVQLKQIIERQDDDLSPFSVEQQNQHDYVAPTLNRLSSTTAATTMSTNQFDYDDENKLYSSSLHLNHDDNNKDRSSIIDNKVYQSIGSDTDDINNKDKINSSISSQPAMVDMTKNNDGNYLDSESDYLFATIGEASIPPFAFASGCDDNMKTGNYNSSSSSLPNEKKIDHATLQSSSRLNNSHCRSHSINHSYQIPAVEASSNTYESANFSKLMRQADDNNNFATAFSQPSITTNGNKKKKNGSSKNYNINCNTVLNSNMRSSASIPFTQSLFNSTLLKNQRRAIALSNVTADSFKLCVQLSPTVSVRDVVDVIANPDMLRFWCEPITALVVTDHKGGSNALLSPSNSKIRDGTRSIDRNQLKLDKSYHYPDVEECDDDIIVPPAEDVVTISSNVLKQQREEYYDGEWIEASTPEILLPPSHETFLDNCFKKVSTFLGFPVYGNVSMFIERSSAQVRFSLGPFKGGEFLSHKMLVLSEEGGVSTGIGNMMKNNTSSMKSNKLILMDEVTVITEDEEVDGWILCSCFESMRDITRSWYKASLDGYIEQTKASLMNLVDLVEGGGEIIAYQSSNRYQRSCNFHEEEDHASQREPFLK